MKVLSYKIRVVVPGVDASVLRTSLADGLLAASSVFMEIE